MAQVEIFTDGACSGNPGPGGWGAILRYGETERELSGGEADTTNNRMELTAAIEALNALNGISVKSTRADSKAAAADVCKCAQEQIKIVSLKLIEYATKQLALPEAPANLSSQLSEPLKVFFLSIKGLDHAGPAELWCKEVIKPWQEVQCADLEVHFLFSDAVAQCNQLIEKLDSLLAAKSLSNLNVIEDWFDAWAKSLEVRTRTCKAIAAFQAHVVLEEGEAPENNVIERVGAITQLSTMLGDLTRFEAEHRTVISNSIKSHGNSSIYEGFLSQHKVATQNVDDALASHYEGAVSAFTATMSSHIHKDSWHGDSELLPESEAALKIIAATTQFPDRVASRSWPRN